MSRMLVAVSVLLLQTVSCWGHFFFILPSQSPQDPVRLIYSDTPEVEPSVQFDSVTKGRHRVIDGAGKSRDIAVQFQDGGYQYAPIDQSVVEVASHIAYGVVLRGQNEPTLIMHHARCLLSAKSADKQTDQHDSVSIHAQQSSDGWKFIAIGPDRKPLSQVAMQVFTPNAKRPIHHVTNELGESSKWSEPGRYAVQVYWTEAKAGEHIGRKYTTIRHYATLVIVIGK